MRLAEISVPKMNPFNGTGCGTADGLRFCSAAEAVKEAVESRLRPLFVADGGTYGVFMPPKTPRAVTMVLDTEDALALFSAPDDIGCVVAAGGPSVLRAARAFAAIRRANCYLLPAEATFDGAFEREGEVTFGGERAVMPLAEGKVFADETLLNPTLARAFARILLARLALFEQRSLCALLKRERSPLYEEAFALCTRPERLSVREILKRSAILRNMENEGLFIGEGVVLARQEPESEDVPEWRAFSELSALYAAFFRWGKPRRYAVPDYARRAAAAGVSYAEISVPAREEYAMRAVALERARGELLREIGAITAKKAEYRRILRAFGGRDSGRTSAEQLFRLPELCPKGLSAVVRDFGLMEK